MSFHAEVMEKLRKVGSTPASKFLALIESENLRPISEDPARTTASEALRLWRTRLKNTRITHKEIEGLPELVHRLEKVTPNKKVDYFAFKGNDSAVTLMFEKTTGAFLGFATVRTQDSHR